MRLWPCVVLTCRLLLQLLLRPSVSPSTKRHVAEILQALAASKLGAYHTGTAKAAARGCLAVQQ